MFSNRFLPQESNQGIKTSSGVYPDINNHINSKHLMTGPEGNSAFCFPRISLFPETKLRETLRFKGQTVGKQIIKLLTNDVQQR